MRPNDFDDEPGSGGALAVEARPKAERPRRFKVLLHNDDFTTMEFVVEHFGKSPAEATHVMLQVHHRGVGVAGVYPRRVAERKVEAVTGAARAAGMPLLVPWRRNSGRRVRLPPSPMKLSQDVQISLTVDVSEAGRLGHENAGMEHLRSMP